MASEIDLWVYDDKSIAGISHASGLPAALFALGFSVISFLMSFTSPPIMITAMELHPPFWRIIQREQDVLQLGFLGFSAA